jgi:hypothetical protein
LSSLHWPRCADARRQFARPIQMTARKEKARSPEKPTRHWYWRTWANGSRTWGYPHDRVPRPGGERTVVRDSDSIEEVTGWILQAEYESDCFPERDTGGGILGKMVLTGEDTLEISVHFDFLWVDNTTYALDEETVVEMNRFLREPR